tara:strand:+ start:449 stop:1441 length:993 start_codon:yes stop_codon:yes gene_type:complete
MYLKQDPFRQLFNKISGYNKTDNKVDKEIENNCKFCKKQNCIEFNGENNICTNCGKVHSEKISNEQEWRYYGYSDTKQSNPTRVGRPTNKLLPESSLGTAIAYSRNYNFNRLRKLDSWGHMPYRERMLYGVFNKIKIKAKAAGFSNIVINEAMELYKELSETRITRGLNRKGLEAACIFIACRNHDYPRTVKEIAKVFNIKISTMTKGVKKCTEIRKLAKSKKFKVKSIIPSNYIDRFCSNLKLQNKYKNICIEVSNRASEIAEDNTPSSIAAGSIFFVSHILNLSITKKQIKKATNISEVTIGKCFKKLWSFRSHLFTKNTVKRFKIKF